MHFDNRHVAPTDRDLLTRYLAEHETRCPGCTAGLAEMVATACPACGVPLELCVRADEPFLRAWATLTVTCALSGGVGLFMILGTIVWGLPFSTAQTFGVAAIIFHITSIPLAVGAALWRRRFVKHPATMQWSVAVAIAAVATLALVTMLASMR